MLFQTKHRIVDAVQFTGAESVADIQRFLAPQSPLYGPPRNTGVGATTLTIIVRNRASDAQWPSIAPHYGECTVAVSSWILREEDGELTVMTDGEFTERFEPVGQGMVDAVEAMQIPEAPPMPIDVPAEGAVPGDDVDPTGPVDTSHVQARRPHSTPSLGDF